MEAVIVGVTPKTAGWWRIETDSRPRFMDTKREDLIDLAQRLLREQSVNILEFNERKSGNINPHTNEPYTDYFFEGAITGSAPSERSNGGRREPEPEREPGRSVFEPEPQAAPRERAHPGFGYQTFPVDAWRMTLGAAAKLAVMTLPLLPVEQRGPEDQWRLTMWWATRIFFSPMPSDNPLDEPHWNDTDEDIPFGR